MARKKKRKAIRKPMPKPSRAHIDKVRKAYERIWRDLLKEDVDV